MRDVRKLAAIVVVAATALSGCAGDGHEQAGGGVVTVEQGQARGSVANGVATFAGLPYAAPPVGARRWTAPAAAPSWSGERDATRYGPACMQDSKNLFPGEKTSEDCLYLNVTAPAAPAPRPRPVYVNIHGGGGVEGSGGPGYNAGRLATRGDIVVVTFNYRLGIWGNLAAPESGTNAGFETQDQQAALRWVQRNIAAFGGDPHNVTLGGESNGALSTCVQLNSPSAQGLFGKAILMSGSCLTSYANGTFGAGVPGGPVWAPLADVQKQSVAVAAQVGCTEPKALLACLRALPADVLLKVSSELSRKPIGTTVLPVDPGRQLRAGWAKKIPILAGTTHDEDLFIFAISGVNPTTPAAYRQLLRTSFGADAAEIERLYPAHSYQAPILAAAAAFSDHDWTCPNTRTNQEYARTSPTWTYLFADPNAPSFDGRPLARPSTPHGSDVQYLFDAPGFDQLSPPQHTLADTMVDYWTAFVRTGDPNHDGATHWPSSAPGTDTALTLAPGSGTLVDVGDQHHCDYWAQH